MATFSFSLPGGSELDGELTAGQKKRWNSLLYQLTEQLRYTLSNLGDENFGSGGISSERVTGLSSEASRIAKAEIGQAKIGAAQVQHLDARVAQIATAVIQTAEIDWAHIATLIAEVARVANAEIGKAVIGSAQVEDLAAAVADIVTANITDMNVKWAEIASLTAAVAEIAYEQVGAADIDFAHIKDLIAGTSIITKGEAGKLFIADLAVTEANMVSLSVGELLVKGADGAFYSVTVDADGQIVTKKKEIVGGDVEDATLGGGKLIQSSITTRELNVAQIFADEAVIRQLTASEILTATLKANILTAGSITAPMIDAGVGAALDLSSNVAILQRVTRDEAEEAKWRVEVLADRTTLRPEADCATLTARVMLGGFDVTEQVDGSALVWSAGGATGKTLTLTRGDVDKQLGVSCFLDTEKVDTAGLTVVYETPGVSAYAAANPVLTSPEIARMSRAAWILCG